MWPTLGPRRLWWRPQNQHLSSGSTMHGFDNYLFLEILISHILLVWSGQVTGYLAEAANVSHTKLNSHFTLRCWFVTFNAWVQTRDVWQMTPKIFSSGRKFVLFKTMQNPDNYLWWELKSTLNIGPYDKGHESAFLILLYWQPYWCISSSVLFRPNCYHKVLHCVGP